MGLRDAARAKLQRALREVLDQQAQEQDGRQTERHEELGRELGLLRAEIAKLHTDVTALAADSARAETLADMRTELGVLHENLRQVEVRARRDLHYRAEVRAATESAAFALEHMPTVPTFPHPDETLRHAAGLVTGPGLALELGVGGGHTLRLMRELLPERRVVGFDVFTGLPEDWRTGFPAGAFAQDEPPEVPGAELVVGLFADTLPGFLADNDEPVAFLHLDADLYSATVTALELIGPRLREGSVVLFDEYFNYPGWQQGEHRAWMEHVQATGLSFRFDSYTYDHEQVVAVVTGQAPSAPEDASSAAASSTATSPE
ncbi:class I SAM-dependent methyltransferase [Rhodococcus sp. X156]|uniref:class I SAM-dependent methyltransferase n=1 Tax=Rhodococcus sp. X156 TaxID=2499145 RepID=UPI000FD92738|nr:class I SAM-dependent methyltransferase [Rhodococcus sp. X156]